MMHTERKCQGRSTRQGSLHTQRTAGGIYCRRQARMDRGRKQKGGIHLQCSVRQGTDENGRRGKDGIHKLLPRRNYEAHCDSSGTEERLYVGGDCYEAPALLVHVLCHTFKRKHRMKPAKLTFMKTLAMFFYNIKFCKAQSWVNFRNILYLSHILVGEIPPFWLPNLICGGIPKDTKKATNSQHFVYELVG